MYISEIYIKNFRSFSDHHLLFSPGLNVLIGHNNAGKTNVLKAIQMVFDRKKRIRPAIEDFNFQYSNFTNSPAIEISVIIEENNDEKDDKNVVYDWLIQETAPYKAQLTYVFALPTKHLNDYLSEIQLLINQDGSFRKNECMKLIEKKYLPKYVAHIYGGDPVKQEKADEEMLAKFDFQFLDAIRDAENQLFYGNNSLLRDVLNYFLDYDLTEGKDFENLNTDQKTALSERESDFKEKSEALLNHLIGRVSKDQILAYSLATGAQRGGTPDFDAEVTELELLFALRLIVEKQGFKLPLKNNGLGYNNLLFIALILAKMQMERSSFMGDNAKVFPILAIEEPEAHLHPSMQYKFLKFLNRNLHHQKQARQAFITTHSTQITAAVDLESIICLYEDCQQVQRVGYPAKVFPATQEGQAAKMYVKRFLDATKSNMLFAEKLVFVEGLAEQLLLPCLAAYLEKEEDLIDQHVAIISVDSRTFKHFLQLFAFHEESRPYSIHRKVVCITDADPTHKELEPQGNNQKRWKRCYPCELHSKPDQYEYQPLASHAQALIIFAADYSNIRICTPESGQGKTLEYELALCNPTNLLLLTDSLPITGKNSRSFFETLIEKYSADHSLEELLAISQQADLKEMIQMSNWPDIDRKRAFFASVYYQALENAKGEHAFYLERQLRENLAIPGDNRADFTVPSYLADSILFIAE